MLNESDVNLFYLEAGPLGLYKESTDESVAQPEAEQSCLKHPCPVGDSCPSQDGPQRVHLHYCLALYDQDYWENQL